MTKLFLLRAEKAVATLLIFAVVCAPTTAASTQNIDSADVAARTAIERADHAERRGQYPESLYYRRLAVVDYRGAIPSAPLLAHDAIAYTYLHMVPALAYLRCERALRAAFAQVVANSNSVVRGNPTGHSYYMSATRERFRQEYEAFITQFGPHGVFQVVNGKPLYGIQYSGAVNTQIAAALKDGAEGKPTMGIRLLESTLADTKTDSSRAQDLNYYIGWLDLLAKKKREAVERFYAAIFFPPSRPQLTPTFDEIEISRYLRSLRDAGLKSLSHYQLMRIRVSMLTGAAFAHDPVIASIEETLTKPALQKGGRRVHLPRRPSISTATTTECTLTAPSASASPSRR